MAVVREIHYPGGGVTRIHDDAYRDLTPEQREARLQHLEETLERLLGKEVHILAPGDSCGEEPFS